MSSRKTRRSPRSVAAPVVPVVDPGFLADLAADDSATLDTAAGISSAFLVVSDSSGASNMLPTTPAAPAAAPRYRRTIGSLTMHADSNGPAVASRTLSIADRFASLGLDPAPLTFNGGIVNVTPPASGTDAALLSPVAPGLVSMPFTRNGDALRFAATLLSYAADPSAAPRGIVSGVTTLYAHDRAMRATRTRPVGYFDSTGVSALDVRASLARAAARLAGLPVSGLGNNAACDITIPTLAADVAARVASLA